MRNGYISVATTLTFDNFVEAFERRRVPALLPELPVIAVPAVILTLFISSMVAFAVSRYSWRFNLAA